MIVIGLDPSLAALGWAVLENGGFVDCGVYVPCGDGLDAKLGNAHAWLRDWLYASEMEKIIAIEMPFAGINANTHYKLSALSGALRAAVFRTGRRVIPIAPAERAKHLGLKGNASKKEIMQEVNRRFGLDITDLDESDAIAISWAGYCKSDLENREGK